MCLGMLTSVVHARSILAYTCTVYGVVQQYNMKEYTAFKAECHRLCRLYDMQIEVILSYNIAGFLPPGGLRVEANRKPNKPCGFPLFSSDTCDDVTCYVYKIVCLISFCLP